MSNCIKEYIFHIKLLNTGYVANNKWRQAPGFELLHHKLHFCSLRALTEMLRLDPLLTPREAVRPVPGLNKHLTDPSLPKGLLTLLARTRHSQDC